MISSWEWQQVFFKEERWAGLSVPPSNLFTSAPPTASLILPTLLHIYTLGAYSAYEILAPTLSKSSTIRDFTIPGSSMLQTSFSLLAHHTSSIFLLLKNEDDLTFSFWFPTVLLLEFISVSADQPSSPYLILQQLAKYILCSIPLFVRISKVLKPAQV